MSAKAINHRFCGYFLCKRGYTNTLSRSLLGNETQKQEGNAEK
jgi:hypothetical protein